MHILLAIGVIIASKFFGDWKKWEQYYPSMLYTALASSLYEFLSHHTFHLWELEPHVYTNHLLTHILHSFFIYPMSIFLYLSNYPDDNYFKQAIYIIKWILIFFVIEWLMVKYFSMISHHNGWSLGWSLFFDVVMFVVVRIHYKNPKVALALSVFWAFFYLFVFDYI
ncbi:CBO0543 family protein [Calidifontibacillus erzurumensis]|uniref:Uncharacterized protein n=1 Tax=Calidifontibacillus erzurumensis TaxID=2741433 RepID=A0A8J8KDQ7_9BACI|nr:CBO0543 family protein [Calidifontibacillus erzurumensis]NSL53258.1 hypothetical protein [Calidifontibacillus erzurumensis]